MTDKDKKPTTKIAMRVGTKEVSLCELQAEWKTVKQKSNAEARGIDKKTIDSLTLRYAKENIISRILIEEEAISVVGEIPFSEINDEYEKMIAHFGGKETFSQKFSSSTTDHNTMPDRFQLLEKIERSIKIERLLSTWRTSVANPTEEKLVAFFEQNPSLYQARKRVVISYLYFDRKSDFEENPHWKIALEASPSFSAGVSALESLGTTTNCNAIKCKEGVMIEQGSDFSLAGFDCDIFFTQNAGIASDVLESRSGWVWFYTIAEIPAGKWEFQHIKTRVTKDWERIHQQQVIQRNTLRLREKATVEDFTTTLQI